MELLHPERTAILVDGAFYRRRAYNLFGDKDPDDRAKLDARWKEYSMVSDAQKRANAKYRREKVKQVVVRFYPNDEDEAIYAHLKAQPRMGEYVKRLVMEDMERAKQ